MSYIPGFLVIFYWLLNIIILSVFGFLKASFKDGWAVLEDSLIIRNMFGLLKVILKLPQGIID